MKTPHGERKLSFIHYSYLINLSIATSTVPTQWKVASICPVPKIPNPKENADFRPISITSVLSRVTERFIVRIGADSTGATGNFAPVLTQEPGQTLRFAPVPFMAVL